MSIDQEKKFIKSLISAIRYFATLDDPRIRLAQFTHSGYFLLDFKKLDRLLESDNKIEFDAKVKLDGKRPIVVIYDKITDQSFLSVRMFSTADGYVRNYIQKEPLLISVTKVRPLENNTSK